MMFKGKVGNADRKAVEARDLEMDPELELALKSFRESVHAWSEAACNRPRRALAEAPQRRVWRLAAGWALGCVLTAGAVSGGIYQVHHRQELARQEAARQAQLQKQLAEEREKEAERLLAEVDSDVSREVPSAMEPLAQMMTEDESQ